jgi:hypothetical protein
VWELILEQCADMFGATVHSRLGRLVLFVAIVFVIGLVLAARWGFGSLVVPIGMLALAVLAARQVSRTRDGVWRAACFELDEPGQEPEDVTGQILAPTAASLGRLAMSVDRVRRARYAEANEIAQNIHRDLLRAEEAQLLDAVRAMISLGLGERGRAASQAAIALPTGSADLDTTLGRTLIMDAWGNDARVFAILSAWQRAGITHGPLARLSTLMRVRIDTSLLDEIDPPVARELADEARAIGDDGLASELDARARITAYR